MPITEGEKLFGSFQRQRLKGRVETESPNDTDPHAYEVEPTRTSIRYCQLDFSFIGDEQAEIELTFYDGQARLIRPTPGCVITGRLVDCPETEGQSGCVVVDTGAEIVAVESPALRELMIENAPCHLEVVAVPLPDLNGRVHWDWDAYEISPNGPRTLVSEPHGQGPQAKLETSS